MASTVIACDGVFAGGCPRGSVLEGELVDRVGPEALAASRLVLEPRGWTCVDALVGSGTVRIRPLDDQRLDPIVDAAGELDSGFVAARVIVPLCPGCSRDLEAGNVSVGGEGRS
jgi:hypothetical protein